MATLSNEVRAFIVQGLAKFQTPQEVAVDVKNIYGVEVTRQHVESHDPTKAAGLNLAKKYKDLFFEYREQFKADISSIPIANLAVRLSRLENEYQKSKNPKHKLEVLEQAAKEVGEVFTNKQTVNSKVEQTTETTHNFTSADEFRQVASEVLSKV